MSNRLFVGTKKGLFCLDRQNSHWVISQTAFLGDPVTIVLPDPRTNTVYAALDLGHFGVKMHRSKDDGKTWEEIATPAYPEPKEGELNNDMWGKPIPWKTIKVWAMTTTEPGVIWCGTLPGGLFLSRDSGNSWELVRSLWDHPDRKKWFGGGADWPGIHSICIDPRDSKRITLGVSCGGVWQSDDNAATWSCRALGMWSAYTPPDQKEDPNIQDVHLIVQCPASPDHFWAQHHNAIFRSTDRSASWQTISNAQPSVFGFAVAVHPKDPKIAWFVPAIKDEKRYAVDGKVVVSRTRDGGETFDVLRNGLPQEHAYDLTYRHCLDVDETGDRLAFGTTTGNLWLTDNQGDSWQTLSNHLPPIFCVRFVK